MQKSLGSRQNKYSIKLLYLLLAVTLLLLLIHFVLQYLNWEVFYQQNGQAYELANRFDLDDESSVPTWFSQILMLLIGLLAFLAAYLQPKKAARRIWIILGFLGVMFSIDEASGLHEYVLQTIHVIFFKDASPTEFNNAWLIVLPIILLASGWLVWQMFKLVPKRTIMIFVLAGCIFLLGAIGVDTFTSITERESFLNQGILTGFEEGLELLASVMVLYGIADYLETYHLAQLKLILDGFRLAKPRNNQ